MRGETLAQRVVKIGVRPLQGRLCFAEAAVGCTHGYSMLVPSGHRNLML